MDRCRWEEEEEEAQIYWGGWVHGVGLVSCCCCSCMHAYMQSVIFTGIYGYAIAAAWTLLGLLLSLIACCKYCLRLRGSSDSRYKRPHDSSGMYWIPGLVISILSAIAMYELVSSSSSLFPNPHSELQFVLLAFVSLVENSLKRERERVEEIWVVCCWVAEDVE